jgi:hypothetical protein
LKELYKISLPGVCCRRSDLAEAGAAKPGDMYCSQGGLVIVQKGLDQSVIRGVTNTFKPFKLAGADGIVLAFCNRESNS